MECFEFWYWLLMGYWVWRVTAVGYFDIRELMGCEVWKSRIGEYFDFWY